MPQTSNSLLSPTKFMVARGNHLCAPLHAPPLHTPSAYPSMYPSPYPLCISPLCTPPHALSTYPLCIPPPHIPSAYLNESDWLMFPPQPIRSLGLKNLININPDFSPTTSLKSLHAARIDQLADSNKPAIIDQRLQIHKNMFLLITSLIVNGFSIRKKFWKAET